MKILHLDPDDLGNPLSGGGPRRTFEIYRRLAQRHEITVLTPTFPGSEPERMREGIRFVRLGRRVGDHGSSHHLTYLLSLPAAVRSHDYDLLVEDFMPPAAVTWTPLFAKAPLIASVQWFFAEEWAERLHLPFELGQKYGIRMYSHFVVLTQAMRRLIESRHERARCAVIQNGVDPALFEIKPEPGSYVLYLGGVNFQQKGVDLLLDAYAQIPRAARVPLILAGPAPDWEPLRERIRSLDLGAHVQVTGKVDAERRNELLAGCRFLCAPSRRETYGMVLAEACAAGKRVISFDLWPMNEVVPRGPCTLVPAFDVAALSRAIQEFSREDEAVMQAEGLRAREAVRGCDWDQLALEQERFYQNVLTGAA